MQANYSYIPPRRRLTAYQFGTTQNQPQESSGELDKLLKANTTLAVWLIFLGIGGGLLALYYNRIGYLPEMEWNAALVYLFVCSIFGGVTGLVLTMSLYLPGVIWCDSIIFERTLDNHLTYYAEHDEPSGKRSRRKEPCLMSIMLYLGLPFLVALVASHWFLHRDYYRAMGALPLMVFVVMLVIFGLRLRPLNKTKIRQIFKYSSWFTLSVLLNQISMYVFEVLANRTPDRYNFLVLTAMCTGSVWISTHVVAARHRFNQRQALIFALLAAVVLVAITDRFNLLSMKLMNRYGIGDNKRVNLLVTKDIIPLLNSEGVTTYDQHVCDVEVLSKVGDHYFVRIGGQVSITLPKKDVIAIRQFDSH